MNSSLPHRHDWMEFDPSWACEFEEEDFCEFTFEEDQPTDEIANITLRNAVLVFDIVILSIAAFSMIANSIVLTFYFMMGHIRKKIPNYMLFVQAAVDLSIAVYAFLTVLPNFFPMLHDKKSYVLGTTILGQGSVLLALGVLILTSLERFIALRKPLLHKRKVTIFKVFICSLVILIFSYLPCVGYLVYTSLKSEVSKKFAIIWFSLRVSVVFGGVFFVLCILILTYRIVNRSLQHNIKRVNVTMRFNERRGSDYVILEQKKQTKIIKIFISLVTVYSVSYLPLAIVNTLSSFQLLGVQGFERYVLDTVVFIFYISSALFNPVLTLVLKDDFRGTFCIILQRCKFNLSASCKLGTTGEESDDRSKGESSTLITSSQIITSNSPIITSSRL